MYKHFKDLILFYLYNNSIERYNYELRMIFDKVHLLNTDEAIEAMIRQNLIYYDAYKLCFTIMEVVEQYKFRDRVHIHIIDDFYKNILLPVAFIDPNRRVMIDSVLSTYRVFMKRLLQTNIRHTI